MSQRSTKHEKTADLGDVRLDLDRRRLCGFPEVVFGESKDAATLKRVIQRLQGEREPVLITRLTAEKGAELAAAFPAGRYNAVARTFRIDQSRSPQSRSLTPSGTSAAANVVQEAGSSRREGPTVAIVTAGTSDIPVAEEVRETIEWMGVASDLVVDVGVAGIHRLHEQLHRIVGSDAVVVVAGMEGALPSVVAGYVDCPVIAVPTSVGYGASLGGIAALLSMLNSCAANVSVVNIDAGFKAGYIAGMIARRAARMGERESGRGRDGGTEGRREGGNQ
jgi:NCAIR mutase (PurE)-related protein